ncbi:glycosyltransferase family 4 protein [Paenibacillus rhizovicinus]|uniref:Glycosyltransferase family 4 protein n=1 Tax=Paenibacillus rhizovicinus TaxID=2704463 RepID=A0A6C0NXB2_9BACL|nr:glycosyltransferase family 4 protein [Paenibacillus rhizovicinus]QHW30860.1 glycosyltransferase family 4 protein [Paenibacillus rhizovicinus]
MNNDTVIFYAPVGTDLPPHLLGGGEIGCRRTREILMDGGYKVITIDKPNMGGGLIKYVKSAFNGYRLILKNLLNNKKAILYIVGFYEKNILLEWIILLTGKMLKYKIIYEARNGRMVKAYQEYGKIYKMLMDFILKKADIVFCQGIEYMEFIKQKYRKHSVYTPNYVLNKNLRKYNANRPLEIIQLIYFGRVTESKNVSVLIDTCGQLLNRGYRVEATIIGAYSEEYKEILVQRIVELGIPDITIRILGQLPFDQISTELQKAHFFIFPSQEKKEGHSNSLTEAMTFGVVPVVSAVGFNSSIVAMPELVVNEIDAEKYVNIIDKIIQDDSWSRYSLSSYNRAKENYTEDSVKESILTAIGKISC